MPYFADGNVVGPQSFLSGRRTALAVAAGGAAALLGVRPSAAMLVNFVVVGNDGWLFSVFDDMKHNQVATIRGVTHLINDAVASFRRAGIQVVIVVTPAKSRSYRDYLPTDFKIVPECEKRYNQAVDLLRAPGTIVPDLDTVISKQRSAHPDQALFLKADSHWTAAGAESAATETANLIKAKANLPPSPGPGTRLGGPVTMRQGRSDLADELPMPISANYPSQTYPMLETVQTPGASALVDEDRSDVLVVGNSFMQPKYNFAAMLSNQLDRPVALVWKVHQLSPYKTLLGALSSDQARRKRLKLLVWVFAEADMQSMPDQASTWGPNSMTAPAFMSELNTVLSL